MKKSINKKHINILLCVLLAVCLVFVGTVLGKFIIDKTIGEKINLNIAGTPQGNVLIGDGGYYAIDEYNENYDYVPTAGFAYQIQTLTEANSKTLGDVTKIVFATEVPSGIDETAEATKIDVSHGATGRIYAYYDTSVDQSTVYVVPKELPTDGISYPMMAHENAGSMFAGLYNLKTIEGMENVFLDNITDSNNMFLDCRALTAVDLSHWTAEKLTDMHYMFAYCMSLKSLDLTSFHTISVENMNSVFWECEALETIELDTEKFVTDKVVDMCDMFGNCNSLKAIDVSGFDTRNVTDMSGMFSGCESLETLDVTGFDTSSVDTIYGMFQTCSLLETIDVSNFDIDMVDDLSDMFLDCDALKTLDLSSWDTSNVTTMWRMFSSCDSLEKLDLSTFNTGSVTDMSSMFSGCTSLNKLYLTGWNTENVANMYQMFQYCYALTVLDLSSFDTGSVVTMRHMFAECGSLQTIYVSDKWSTEKVVNAEDDGDDYIDEFEGAENELFNNCWSLVGGQGTYYGTMGEEDSENYNHKKYAVIDKAQELQEDGNYGAKGYLTLYEAYTLTTGAEFNEVIFNYLDATSVTFGSYNMLKGEIGDIWNDETVSYVAVDDKGQGTIRSYLITNDYGTGIYIVSKDSSVIFANQDCGMMFWGMTGLTSINGLNKVDTRNTTDMNFMFADCWLTDLDVSGFDTGNVTNMIAMFSACMDLSWLNVSGFDTSNVTTMNGMFANCSSLYSLDISDFDTSNVNDMKAMFSGCSALSELDLSKWNTVNVTNMASMFDECTSLETIYAGAGWNTDNVTDHELMFDNCTVLVGGQGTAFDSNYIDKTYALIDAAREPNGAKGYLTDADYGTKSKILLPGGEFNAELAALLTANEGVTKVQFGEASQFSENLDFSVWDETAWAENAKAVLDVARSGNISAFVAGDTVYVLAKEVDYEQGSVIFANADCANMFRHNVGDETSYIPSGRLTAIDGLSIVDTSNTTDMSYMFSGSSNLATVDLRSFNTAGVTNMSYMFYGCNSIGGLSLSGFDTGKVTDMSYMFYDCDSLTAQKLSSWDVRNVTNMNSMFYSCDKLNTLDLTGWNTSYVTDMTAMFSGNSVLTTVYVNESWKTGRVDSSEGMFTDCTAIVGGQGTVFDPDYTDKTYAVIDKAESDGIMGYLTYEEAYTLISGPDFSWMLWDGDGKDEYYGLSDNTIEWAGFDGGDVRITKIVFGSYDEYKETLSLTSWDDLVPGIALDAEQEGNIRLYIPDFDWSNTQGDSYDQTYYVLSKGSSKIIANEDCSGLLRSGGGWEEAYGLTWPIYDRHLTEIVGLDKLDTRYVTDMSMMFEYFAGESLDLSNFDTSNVTNMSYMFNYCDYLASIDVTGFDTSSVTDMSYMFNYCSALETIDVSKFETGKVTDMNSMFYSMSGLTSLNVSSFDTGKVTDMSNMFAYIYADKLDISSFSTAGYPYIDGMFYGCMNTELGKHLTTIYASELWDPDKVRVDEYGYSVFGGSEMLVGGEGSTYAETAGADSDNDYKFARNDRVQSANDPGLFTDKNAAPLVSDVKLMPGADFNGIVTNLLSGASATKLQFGTWAQYGEGLAWPDGVDVGVVDDTIKAFVKDGTVYVLAGLVSDNKMVADASCATMFKDLSTLTSIDGFSIVNTAGVTDMSDMFSGCSSLTSVDTVNLTTTAVTTMKSMFSSCSGLSDLDLSSFATSIVTDMSYMFNGCSKLATLNRASSFDTSSVTDMSYMFRGTYFDTLDLSDFNTSRVENMSHMFENCTRMVNLSLTNFNTISVTDMSYMFSYCGQNSMTSLDLSGFVTTNVKNMSYMFSHCGQTKLTSLDLSNFDTINVTDMSYMFEYCGQWQLTSLDVSNFDTVNVTNMRAMFSYCGYNSLTSLDVSSFDTSNVTTMRSMFNRMQVLTELKGLEKFDTGKVEVMREMFAGLRNMTALDLSSFVTNNVNDMGSMFYECTALTELDLSGFDTSKVLYMGVMFYSCYRLQTIYAGPGWSTESIQGYNERGESIVDLNDDVFDGCSSLVGGAGTRYTTARVKDYTYACIDQGSESAAPGYLTYKDPIVTLTTGDKFNSVIKTLFEADTTLNTITFGTLDELSQQNADLPALYEASTYFVDVGEQGLIRAVTSGTTVYILSDPEDPNNSTIYANTNSNNMFRHNIPVTDPDTQTAVGYTNYIPAGRVTAINGLSSVNTGNVTRMFAMFLRCSGLTSLDVSGFDTSSVTNMRAMFESSTGLTELDLSGFDTSSVTTMQNMFYGCSGLTSLDVTNFDTSSVTTMQNMFYGCSGLTSLNVSNFNTSEVTTMRSMFYNCSGLTSLDLSNFDTSRVTAMQYMFLGCSGLTSLDVISFDTSKVTNMQSMFYNCSGLPSIDLSSFNTSEVTTMGWMFYGCSGLPSLDVSGFDTSKVTTMQSMFYNCSGLISLDLSNFNTSEVTHMGWMFLGCSGLTSLDVSSFDTSKVTTMQSMFYNCSKLPSLNVSNFNTSEVTAMQYMFYGCSGLPSLDISNFNTSKVTDMQYMFYGCSGLTSLDLSNFNTSEVTLMGWMFRNCWSLTSLDVSSFNTSKVTHMEAMFRNCSGLTTLDVSSFDTSKVTNMVHMFRELSVTSLDLSNFDTSSLQNSSNMFNGCTKLTTIYVSNLWNMDTVTTSPTMFAGCDSLVGGEGTTIAKVRATGVGDRPSLEATYARIDCGEINPGYLTDKYAPPAGTFTLKTGSNFSTAVRSLITSSGATKIQFGSWVQYGYANSFDWYDDTATVLDVNNEGTIKAFAKDGIIYILSGGDMVANQNCNQMFTGMSTLTAIEGLSAVDTSNVTNMSLMFNACYKLESIDLSKLDTSSVQYMGNMFTQCRSLTSLDLSNFDTGKVVAMNAMFSSCVNLESVNVSGFDTSGVKSMLNMFNGCSSLTTLDLSNFDTSGVTDMLYMFNNCSALETIYVSSALWSTAGLSETDDMFTGCTNLVGGAGTKFSEAGVTDSTYAIVDGGTASPGYLTAAPVTLTTGTAFNAAIKALFDSNTTVAKLRFGAYNDYAATVGTWDSSSNYVDIDKDGDGNADGAIRLFVSDDTVYILSEGSSPIYANADCSNMFRQNASTSETAYIPSGNITAIDGLELINTSNVTVMSRMFYGSSATALDGVSGWDTSNVTNMYGLFYDSNITSINLSAWNTSKVTDMYGLFRYCWYLTNADISGFDMSKISSTVSMFDYCQKLVTLKLPEKFITSKATAINHTFYRCEKLASIDVSGWDTSNVKYMQYLFYRCEALTSLDVSNWNTENVLNMNSTFREMTNLTSLDLSSFDTSKVTDMGYMFQNSGALTSLNLSSFDTSKVSNMEYMFSACKALTSLDLSGFVTSNVSNMKYMFRSCQGLTTLDVSGLDTGNVTDMSYMFADCQNLTALNVSNWNTGNVTTMNCMFNNCKALKTLDLSSFDTQKVTDMYYMFYGCSKLETIYVSELWTVEAVTESTYMFSGCTALVGGEGTAYDANVVDATYAHIDGGDDDPGYLTDRWPSGVNTLISGDEFKVAISDLISSSGATKLQFGLWADYGSAKGFTWANGKDLSGEGDAIRAFASGDTVYILSNDGDMFAHEDSSSMFEEMSTITAINGLDMLDTSKVTSMWRMFKDCSSLQELDLFYFDTSQVTNMYSMFECCTALTKVNVSGFNTALVTDMEQMFADCNALTELDVSSFDTSQVTQMGYMFGGCSTLTSLDLSSFDTRNVEGMDNMFLNDSALQTIYVGDLWSTDAVTTSVDMFYGCTALKGGNGTAYDDVHFDAEYAHIDGGTSNPGYFTDPA